jgi:hypothetical protein
MGQFVFAHLTYRRCDALIIGHKYHGLLWPIRSTRATPSVPWKDSKVPTTFLAAKFKAWHLIDSPKLSESPLLRGAFSTLSAGRSCATMDITLTLTREKLKWIQSWMISRSTSLLGQNAILSLPCLYSSHGGPRVPWLCYHRLHDKQGYPYKPPNRRSRWW